MGREPIAPELWSNLATYISLLVSCTLRGRSKIISTIQFAGDLLRAERASGSELADMINTYINEGKIVPAEVTVRLLHNAMEQALKENNKNKFLVDGFPRDLGNLQCWTEKLSDLAETKFLLFLDCPTEIMVDRLVENFAGH